MRGAMPGLEVEHQWMHNETVSIRVEADPDAP
jgi:hypothetical protein